MKVVVKMPTTGKPVTGEDVPIDESTERWSDLKLRDGTVIRVKQSVAQVVRVDGEYDQEDNPMYIVRSTPAVAVVYVDPLLKKGHKAN